MARGRPPKIGSRKYLGTTDDGSDLFSEVISFRKGSKPFKGIFPYYFTTTRTVKVKRKR